MKWLVIFLLLPLKLFSQDITGVWTGTLYNDTTQKYLAYEIAISEYKGRLSGYSHTIFVIDNKEETGVKSLKIKKKNNKYFIEDDELIYNNYAAPPPKEVKQFSLLSLKIKNTLMMLDGEFNTNRTRQYSPLTGTVHLQKKKDTGQTKLISKLKELDLSKTLSFLQSKEKDVAIVLNSSSDKSNLTLEPNKESKTIAQPKTQEIVSTQKTETKIPIVQPKFKEKEIITSAQKPENKAPVVESKTKIKDAVITTPPTSIKKLRADPQPKEKLVVISQPQTIKKQTSVSPPKQKEIITAPVIKPPVITNEVSSVISAADLEKRKIETIKSVYFKSDSLLLTLYDNGEVDGDTVSVILNGKTIISKQGLSTKAINKTIYITPDLGDSLQLIMYAENLGSIPPNTGLLILQDGNDRYEIRFAGDLQKNSAIILRRKSLSH